MTRVQVYLFALALAAACIASIAAATWRFDTGLPWWGVLLVAPAAAILLRTLTMRTS